MLDKAKPLLLLAGTLSPLRPGLHRYTRRKVTSGYQFLEGPVWSKDGYLLFSDVPVSKVLRIDENGIKPFRTPSGKTNGNTIDALGRVLSCESEGRRVVRQDKKGNWEVLADKWEGKLLNAPNDIVVRKDGHIYFTDPAFGNQADTRELNFYGVYHIPPKGPMELVAKPKGRPNGIAFSPKGNLLYVTNTMTATLWFTMWIRTARPRTSGSSSPTLTKLLRCLRRESLGPHSLSGAAFLVNPFEALKPHTRIILNSGEQIGIGFVSVFR